MASPPTETPASHGEPADGGQQADRHVRRRPPGRTRRPRSPARRRRCCRSQRCRARSAGASSPGRSRCRRARAASRRRWSSEDLYSNPSPYRPTCSRTIPAICRQPAQTSLGVSMARHSRHTPFWQREHSPTAAFTPCESSSPGVPGEGQRDADAALGECACQLRAAGVQYTPSSRAPLSARSRRAIRARRRRPEA